MLSHLLLFSPIVTAETGVVSWLSKFVAEKKISLLYLSTFPSAFIMVRCSVCRVWGSSCVPLGAGKECQRSGGSAARGRDGRAFGGLVGP